MERFKVYMKRFSELYQSFCESGLEIFDFVVIYTAEILDLLRTDIPKAASVALGVSESELKKIAHPFELLSAAAMQWIHNMEISKIKELFPHPEDEESDSGVNFDNPVAMVERLMSGGNRSFDEAIRLTYPFVYLMSVSSAEAYQKIKSGSDEGKSSPKKPGPIEFNGVVYDSIKDLAKNPEVYKAYFAQNMARLQR